MIEYFVHPHPVWRDRANYVAHVFADDGGNIREQIWTRILDDGSHEVCCIPLFVYNLSLGDYVEVNSRNIVVRVLKSSGIKVFRAFFPKQSRHLQANFMAQAESLGAIVEHDGASLIGLACDSKECVNSVVPWLTEMQACGAIEFERAEQECSDFYSP